MCEEEEVNFNEFSCMRKHNVNVTRAFVTDVRDTLPTAHNHKKSFLER